ncbi:hypothetical protein Nos7107_4664 [Nostoc sp. PCC 7107]|nr:hypothetical protein Nos7107_4664 [Nostoc sp. PCC 7107]
MQIEIMNIILVSSLYFCILFRVAASDFYLERYLCSDRLRLYK